MICGRERETQDYKLVEILWDQLEHNIFCFNFNANKTSCWYLFNCFIKAVDVFYQSSNGDMNGLWRFIITGINFSLYKYFFTFLSVLEYGDISSYKSFIVIFTLFSVLVRDFPMP